MPVDDRDNCQAAASRQSERIRASVVIVTFNHRDAIRGCLEPLRPTLGPDDEVVVIDNASSDGTADLIEQAYPWVRLIRSDWNRGFGAACNLGATRARGRVLVFLNPDTEPRPGWLDALLGALDSVPLAGLVTAKLLLARAPHLIDTFGNEVHISGITTSRGWGQPADSYTQIEEVSAISGACFAISHELFTRLAGFDEQLFLYYEDTDLSLRARLAGYRCIAVPGAVVLHDHTPGFSPAKLRYLERNRWWTLLKLYRLRTLIALSPVLLLGEFVAWGMALRGGPGSVVAKFSALADLIQWLPGLRSLRASAVSSRLISDRELIRPHAVRLRTAQVVTGPLTVIVERAVTVAFRTGSAFAAGLGN